jgi:hypothetical protein
LLDDPQHQREKMQMTLSTNDEFANRELSIEELDTIAAAGLISWIKGEASSALHVIENVGKAAVGLGEFLIGPPAAHKAMYHELF